MPRKAVQPGDPGRTLQGQEHSGCVIIFIVVVMFILSISLKSILFFQVFERYNAYLDSFYQVSVGQALASFFTSYFPIVLLMFFFSLNRNFSKNDKDFQFLWVVTFFFCAFIIMRFIETYFFRVAYYYQLGEILIISRICQKPSIKDNNGGLLTNYFLSEYDFLVVLVIIISFYIQLRMYDLSPLINYSIME